MKSNVSFVLAIGAITFCLTVPAVTRAQEPSARIVEYGRYAAAAVKNQSVAHNGNPVKNQAPVETTTEIPAKIGELFGICVALSDLPKDRGCTVRREIHHPPFTEPDGKVSTKSVYTKEIQAGAIPLDCAFFGWRFIKGSEYEIVPGQWTWIIYIDDKEVVSKTFQVKKPEEPAPLPGSN